MAATRPRAVESYLSSIQRAKETVLYSFCAQTNCTDGAGPYGGLIVDRLGNLYGTAAGGAYEAGVTYLSSLQKGKETVLYSLCSKERLYRWGRSLRRAGPLTGREACMGRLSTAEFGNATHYGCYSGCGTSYSNSLRDPRSA